MPDLFQGEALPEDDAARAKLDRNAWLANKAVERYASRCSSITNRLSFYAQIAGGVEIERPYGEISYFARLTARNYDEMDCTSSRNIFDTHRDLYISSSSISSSTGVPGDSRICKSLFVF